MSTAKSAPTSPEQTSRRAKENPQYTAIAKRTIEAFDEVNGGVHAGSRPAHAKGILLMGWFTPSPDAAALTLAPHVEANRTAVSVRFSDFAGIPTIDDTDAEAGPRGMALRFHLAEHVHTDIIAHSVDGFPARTAEEFVEFLHAIVASRVSNAKPLPIEVFLATHPSALEFVQLPKPLPVSFATEAYFGVSAYKFINKDGVVRYGRYRIRPENGTQHVDAVSARKQSSNVLFDEIQQRISQGPVKMTITVQIADDGDVTDDSTVHWPAERPEIEFGSVQLTAIAPNNAEEQQHIIFDPIPRVDGIEPSNDPLLNVRAETYLMSGRRRRSQGTS